MVGGQVIDVVCPANIGRYVLPGIGEICLADPPWIHVEDRVLYARRYGAIQDLVFADFSDRPHAWVLGGGGLGSAQIITAERYEYHLRSSLNPLRISWKLVDGAGTLARITQPKHADGLRITLHRPPIHAHDAQLLLTLAAFTLLQRAALHAVTAA